VARQRRTGWRRLTPGYRAFLQRQGNTQRSWESGAPIKRARSEGSYARLSPQYRDRLAHVGVGPREYQSGYSEKRPPPLTSKRVDDAVERVSTASDRREDMGVLRRWYRSNDIPPWLRDQPGLNKVATAAALSQIASPPSTWRSVSFEPTTAPVWNMTVTFDDGSSTTIQVPGYVVEDIRAWAGASGRDISNDIGGTDTTGRATR